MHTFKTSIPPTGSARYSAKKMAKPINFYCEVADASHVSVSGDFNNWSTTANPMVRQTDGRWLVTIELHHGHHHYVFLVDGKKVLDPKASGVGRDMQNEKVSLLAVS
jgi:1,4-alpha-glucan branching enzyme